MFWDNLNQWEQDRYYALSKHIAPWLAWCSLSNTKRELIPEPEVPTDDQLHDVEMLSMKGWGML